MQHCSPELASDYRKTIRILPNSIDCPLCSRKEAKRDFGIRELVPSNGGPYIRLSLRREEDAIFHFSFSENLAFD